MYVSSLVTLANSLNIIKPKQERLQKTPQGKVEELVDEYRHLVLSPKVTLEGETRLMEIMDLATNNEQLASAMSEVDLKIGVAIGAIDPIKAKTALYDDIEV